MPIRVIRKKSGKSTSIQSKTRQVIQTERGELYQIVETTAAQDPNAFNGKIQGNDLIVERSHDGTTIVFKDCLNNCAPSSTAHNATVDAADSPCAVYLGEHSPILLTDLVTSTDTAATASSHTGMWIKIAGGALLLGGIGVAVGGGGGGDDNHSSHLMPPTVKLTNDTGTSNSDNITNDAHLTTSEIPSGVTRVYRIDGGEPVSNYSPIISSEDGVTHTIVVVDTDAAGNTASSSITFTLDNVAPSEHLSLTLNNDSGVSDSDFITNAHAITLWSDDGSSKDKYLIIDGDQNHAIAADAVDLSTLADGTHTFQAFVSDVAGNTVSSVVLTYILDTAIANPSASFDPISTSAVDLSNTSPTLLETPKADDIVLREYTLYNAQTDTTNIGTTFTMPSNGGGYELTIQDTDKAGNIATSTPFRFILGVGTDIDMTDPNSNWTDSDAKNTVFIGGGGNDVFHAEGGADIIYGCGGNDDAYINADNLSQLLVGKGLIDGGDGFDVVHINDVVADFNLANLVDYVKNIEVIQFNQSPSATITLSASDIMAISTINGIGASNILNDGVLDSAKYQMLFASSADSARVLLTNVNDWTKVGSAVYATHTFDIYNSLSMPVQILL